MRKLFDVEEKPIAYEDLKQTIHDLNLEKVRALKAAFFGCNQKKYAALTGMYAYCQTLKSDKGELKRFFEEPYFVRFTYELKPERILSYGMYYLLDVVPKSSEYRRARVYANAFQAYFDDDESPLVVWDALRKRGLNGLIEDSEDDEMPRDVGPRSSKAKAKSGVDARTADDNPRNDFSFEDDRDETDNDEDNCADGHLKPGAEKTNDSQKEKKQIMSLRRSSEKRDFLLVEHVDSSDITIISELPANEEFYIKVIKKSSETEWWELELVSVERVQRPTARL